MADTLKDPFDRPLTHLDLDYTPDDGNRYEIIDGVCHVTPFPTAAHQHVASQLMIILGYHVREHQMGKVFTAGLKVVLDEPSGVGPDLVYISTARMVDLKPDAYYGSPDLVVEVLSSKPALDQFVKKQKYAQAGVPRYWIIDPEKRQLWSYRLDGDRYRIVVELSENDAFEPDLFPGLTVRLSELWL